MGRMGHPLILWIITPEMAIFLSHWFGTHMEMWLLSLKLKIYNISVDSQLHSSIRPISLFSFLVSSSLRCFEDSF